MKYLINLSILCFVASCSPTVKFATPEKPIEINLNIKVEHELKVKIDKELDDVMKKSKDIF